MPGAPPAPPALLQRLLDDHRRILPTLEHWVQRVRELPARAAEDRWPELRASLDDLAGQLRRHAALEEQTLFAAMGEVLGSQALTGYALQHDDIEELLDELLAASAMPAAAGEKADRLWWICESHFEIEETYLFQEALRRLAPEQWEMLADAATSAGGDPSAPGG